MYQGSSDLTKRQRYAITGEITNNSGVNISRPVFNVFCVVGGERVEEEYLVHFIIDDFTDGSTRTFEQEVDFHFLYELKPLCDDIVIEYQPQYD